MKRTWIHFVGKKYYTINQFIKEAKESGISRAISPHLFQKMEFGDTVLLAQKDKTATKIFGGFVYKRIVGLSDKATVELYRQKLLQFTGRPDKVIKRGCGEYRVQEEYVINDEEMTMDILRSMDKKELGKVMIGGDFMSVQEIFGLPGETEFILCEIPFQMGFRMVDFDQMKDQVLPRFEAIQKMKGNKHVKIKGQFYYDQGEKREQTVQIEDPKLLSISGYKLN